jgi:hypothetical protein
VSADDKGDASNGDNGGDGGGVIGDMYECESDEGVSEIARGGDDDDDEGDDGTTAQTGSMIIALLRASCSVTTALLVLLLLLLLELLLMLMLFQLLLLFVFVCLLLLTCALHVSQNRRRIFGYSRALTARTAACGAHPPGLTDAKYCTCVRTARVVGSTTVRATNEMDPVARTTADPACRVRGTARAIE